MLIGEKKFERAPFRYGIVGGGRTSNVGYKHRLGAMRDNTSFVLTAAAFDLDYDRCKDFGKGLGMAEDRLYPDYKTMFAAEAKRPDGIEVVDIATPNFQHFEVCKAALEAGLHVICEKPLFFTVAEGVEIQKLAKEKNRAFCVTYGFSGFDLLMQMRAMIQNGDIGEVTMVDLRYAHGFGCDPTGDKEAEGQKWRVDPKKSGPSFVLGDSRPYLLYVRADLPAHPRERAAVRPPELHQEPRPAGGHAYVLMRYDNGAVGRMWASSVNAGDMSSQHIRIVGTKASLEWNDMHPDELQYQVQGQPIQTLIRAMDYLAPKRLSTSVWVRCTTPASSSPGPTCTTASR